MSKPYPLLLMSDSPHLRSGLARITRDLATVACSLPDFRVGTFGRGGWGCRRLPWAQYNFPESAEWGQAYLENCWRDFAGDQVGVILTIQDPSRVHWFAQPQYINDCPLKEFLQSGRFRRWGYFPVDGVGVHNKLSVVQGDAIQGYDRALAYGAWGAEVIANTIGREVEWIPHGYNSEVFQPRGREAGRMALCLKEEDLVIAAVMTNQARKNWGLAFQIAEQLRRTYSNLKFLAVVDVMTRYWSIDSLVADFDASKYVKVIDNSNFTDTELSYLYSACDLTILPSLGEGFGFPVVESMACGVPCVTGGYGGSVELVPKQSWLVEPHAWRMEGACNITRPVYNPMDWVKAIKDVLHEENASEWCCQQVEHLRWDNLHHQWKKWLLEGVK